MKQLAWPEDGHSLEDFLGRTNAWVLRPLTERVALPDFAAKLLRNGVVLLALDRELGECGIVALYCNDQIDRVGFITLLGVHPQCRGRGLGHLLLQRAVSEMRAQGMTRVRLQVAADNCRAIAFYLSHGFHEAGNDRAMAIFPRTFYMEKALLPDAGK
ncbi:MAG: GNAT family N-acetyltransferase [Lacunisphaera sp.]